MINHDKYNRMSHALLDAFLALKDSGRIQAARRKLNDEAKM